MAPDAAADGDAPQGGLEQRLRRADEAEAKASAMAHEVVAMAAARKEADRRATVMQHLLDAVKAQLEPLRQANDQLSREKDELLRTVSDLKRQVQASGQQQTQLQRRLDRAQKAKLAASENRDVRFATLEMELDASRADNEALRARAAELQRRLHDAGERAAELDTYRTNNHALTTMNSELQQKLEIYEDRAASRGEAERCALEALSVAQKEHDEQLGAMRQRVAALEGQVRRMEEEKARQAVELQALHAELGDRDTPPDPSCTASPNQLVDRLQHDAVLRNTLLCIFNQRQRDLEEQLAARGAECRSMALRVQSLEQRLRETVAEQEAWVVVGQERLADVSDAVGGLQQRLEALGSVLLCRTADDT